MTLSTLTGSCLCGSVQYEITGSPTNFFHCHCERCRRASGTGHASNVILKLDEARWIAGEDLVKSYKVPEAERFRNVFCDNCGSPLPKIARERGFAIIPAGSLDTAPPIGPTARIFWGSRAEWSCEGGDFPAWDEYPEKT